MDRRLTPAAPERKKRRRHPEQTVHQAIVRWLSVALAGGAWFSTFPAGGGGELRGKILAGMGMKSGVPDILVIWQGLAHWLEVKAKRGYCSPAQKLCHLELQLAGCPVAVVRSVEEAETALAGWGILLRPRIVR